MIPQNEIVVQFARSGGPGGQNVNKVNTKAVARWNVGNSNAYSFEQKLLIRKKLSNRLASSDEIIVSCDENRSQLQNKIKAIKLLQMLVAGALKVPKKRLLKVILPVSFTVVVLTLLDFWFLQRSYPVAITIKNLLGFFPQADLYSDINSPLWFITPLLAYYILFPLFAHKRAPFVLPLAFLGLGYLVTQDWFLHLLPVTDGVRSLYRVHAYGFGLGTLLGLLLVVCRDYLVNYITSLSGEFSKVLPILRYVLFTTALAGLTYTLTHPKVGAGWKPEQAVSLYSSGLVILAMMLKPVEIRMWSLIGVFSFFIYLVHWPLFYRYDFLFNRIPSGFAMIAYLAIFLGVGYGYNRIKNR